MTPPPPRQNEDAPVLSVAELNRSARIAIEQHFQTVWVTGEMSNFARPRSGHWYFTLKDAQAQVRCAMFANRNRAVQMQPGDGQMVLLRGRVSLYEGRGDFQVIVDYMEPAGEGALRQAFDALKRKLLAEGLFDASRKKPLPDPVRRVAVITSPSGAALHDALSVWRRRYPLLEVTLLPSAVQGDAAADALIRALQMAARLPVDAILVTRGGGSLEDLWSFNLESVAREIAACPLPVVSAVGHEIDTTICDLVADVRAPTPSAAAELLTPDQATIRRQIDAQARALVRATQQALSVRSRAALHLRQRLPHPQQMLERAAQRADDAGHRITMAMRGHLRQARDAHAGLRRALHNLRPAAQIAVAARQTAALRERLGTAAEALLHERHRQVAASTRMLENLSPLPTLSRGYGILIDADRQAVTRVEQVTVGQQLQAYLGDGHLEVEVQATGTQTLTDFARTDGKD